MTALDDIGAAVRDIAGRVGPSVAGIGRGWGRGSGVVVRDGLILTNAHVLRGEEVVVTLGGGAVEGRVVGADLDVDLAVIAAPTGGAAPIEWDPEATDVGIGAPVVALADPGGRGLRATFGFVSAADRSFRGPRGRTITGSIEHTAPLPRGSSGGPLVDGSGRLLGLNTARLEGGLILALPADAALRKAVDALAAGRAPKRPRLGVALAPPRASKRMRAAVGLDDREGLLVRAVQDGSPAAAAGIARGDLLVAAGGRPLTGVDDLFDALEAAERSGGEPARARPSALTLTIVRGSEERDVAVELA